MAEFSQPRNVIGGHVISALVESACINFSVLKVYGSARLLFHWQSLLSNSLEPFILPEDKSH